MKFFIPLGHRYGKDGGDINSHIDLVYGPYDDDEAVEGALARLWPNDKEKQFLVFDGKIVNVTPSAKERPESEKRAPGNKDHYVRDGEGYKCKDCGGRVSRVQVAHPVHLRAMPGVGSGECRYERILYCPNCDKKPDLHGAPVYE